MATCGHAHLLRQLGEAVVELLERLRHARAAELRALGYSGQGFAPFEPLQPHGRGTWPNGTQFATTPRVGVNHSAPGGKCASGMFVADWGAIE